MSSDPHLSSEQLSDLAEGLFSQSEKATFELHIQSCELCQIEFDILKDYFNDLKSLPVTAAPPNFLANVRSRVEITSRWKTFWKNTFGFKKMIPAQLAMLTLLGVGIIGTYILQNEQPSNAIAPAHESQPADEPRAEKSQPKKAAKHSSSEPKLDQTSESKANSGILARSPPPASLSSIPRASSPSSAPAPIAEGMVSKDANAAMEYAAADRADDAAGSEPIFILHLAKRENLAEVINASQAMGIDFQSGTKSENISTENSLAKKSKAVSVNSQEFQIEFLADQQSNWIQLLSSYGELSAPKLKSAPKYQIRLKIIQP